MNFNQLIGQQSVIQSLRKSIENNTISHAYIFEGPHGIGKKTVASIFAAALTCEAGYTEPCGVCRSCLKNESGNHPDVKILDENEGSIGIDAIRELQKDIYIRPYEAAKKIYIIPLAERMTIQAQNGLLKVLEEPPEYGMMILTATSSALLLETILSRSMLVRFRIHPYHEVEAYLKKKHPEMSEEIPFLALFSGGVIGRANEIAASNEFKQMRRKVTEIVLIMLDIDELSVLHTRAFFNEHKNDIDMILDFLLLWFRDILLMKELHSDNMVINIDMDANLRRFAQKVSSYTACKIIHVIIDTKKKISMNANYTLAIETMLIESWEEIHGKRSRSTV